MTVKRYTDLVAWQKGMDLVEVIYRVTKTFPKEEVYGITAQMRRAAISIPSNIAEGHCRSGRREFVHHLSIALGSLGELETQVTISERLGFLSAPESSEILITASETGRLIVGLMHSLERHAAAS